MPKLSQQQLVHLTHLIKQKFISPYKIIYIIDQKEADYFKARNQGSGCCAASQITIKREEQTSIQRELASLISGKAIEGYLVQLMEYCEDRYKNITEKGKHDNLSITKDVQKYLLDNILAESVNSFIHKKLITKLSQQSYSLVTQIGLRATPATWNAKYPNVMLEMFNGKDIKELLEDHFCVLQGRFKSILTVAIGQILLLERDGRFEEVLGQGEDNFSKVLRNVLIFANPQDKQSSFKNLARLSLLLQSIPFQLNMKTNSYLTITETVQACFYTKTPHPATKNSKCRFQVILSLNADLKFILNGERRQERIVKAGDILIVDNKHNFSLQGIQNNKREVFVFRCFISQAQRK